MAEKLVAEGHTWRFIVSTPPREIFAVFEQMCGTPPYRYEVVGADTARIVEFERNSPVGHWRQLARTSDGEQSRDTDGRPVWKTAVRWVTVRAAAVEAGTAVTVTASRGLRGPFGRLAGGGVGSTTKRGLQLVQLLTRGGSDRRTLYRDRRIPAGPVSLVASWAGMLYPIYLEPRYDAQRGEGVHTASRLTSVGNHGIFVRVRLPSGVEGYIERDQVVPAAAEATREAGERRALIG